MEYLKILAPAHTSQSTGIAPVSFFFYHLDQHVLLPSQLTGEGGTPTHSLPSAWGKNSILITIQRWLSDAAHSHCPDPGVCLTMVSTNVTQREDLTLGTWRTIFRPFVPMPTPEVPLCFFPWRISVPTPQPAVPTTFTVSCSNYKPAQGRVKRAMLPPLQHHLSGTLEPEH